MSRPDSHSANIAMLALLLGTTTGVCAQDETSLPGTADRQMHGQSATQHEESPMPTPEIKPAVPEGMTLDEVFDVAESPPPANFPQPVPDDRIYAFALFDQLEYRVATKNEGNDHLGWEAQGWIGGDFNKFWWKNEGEAVIDGPDEAEMETDLLYSRLISPFWNFQIGTQYASEWHDDTYDDRWSGVIALQGLAPYKFELDNSLYVSEDSDITLEIEGEYDVRITQRLVIQPRVTMGFAFQDIPERRLGSGMTEFTFDLRLRYEIKRELAPYFGLRSQSLVGETEDMAEADGEDSEPFFLYAGIRFAF